jgi:hypothetical protein
MNEALTRYIGIIKGSPFIKESKMLGDSHLLIKYFSSYSEFKEARPNTNQTEESFNEYFSTGNAIKKIFVGEPARILREFPEIFGVTIEIEFEGENYEAHVTREKLKEIIGFNIQDTSVKNNTWKDHFADVYIYGSENEKRDELFEHLLCSHRHH